MKKAKILIADDDYIFCELTKYILTDHQYEVLITNDSRSTIDFVEEDTCDLILLDLYFPDFQSGINTLKTLKETAKNIPIIIITSDNLNYENRFSELIESGASDIIEKPLQEDRLLLTISNTLAYSDLARSYSPKNNDLIYLVGKSQKIVQINNAIDKHLRTNNYLMLFGDSGTGVVRIAKKIHQYSNRHKKKMIIMDCSKINLREMQTALFGNPKEKDIEKKFKNLKIVQAQNSTLIIANAHLMPEKLQERLVRALSGRKLNSLNGYSFAGLNTKLIFTTKKEYYNDIYANNISAMLFNLCKDKIIIPSLNERVEDIPLIVEQILMIYNQTTDSNISITGSALNILKRHNWVNSIDELKSTILNIILQLRRNEITNKNIVFPNDAEDKFVPLPFKQAMKDYEKNYLEQIMELKEWNLNEAAIVLHIDRSNLFRKLQKHGIKIKKH